MRIHKIQYENFRNHPFLTFKPDIGINLVYGPNGSGKTSLLEGIHYCALTKGFNNATDNECLLFDSDFFLLESNFISQVESVVTVKVIYTKQREKQIIVNNCDVKPFSRHIGTVPCITFSPAEIVIVNGSPGDRRRFMDNAISQTNRRYLDDLLAYRRVLLQRNTLLFQMRENQRVHPEMLPLWNEHLSRLAASIVYARNQFISVFSVIFNDLYQYFSRNESPFILYRSSIGTIDFDISPFELYSIFLKKCEESKKVEIFRSQTLIGPHRDDLFFQLNGKEIKKYASRGQLRTFLITIKLAQHRYVEKILGDKPLCLFDDIFSELDSSRRDDIFSILETSGQSIITSTENPMKNNVNHISMGQLKRGGER
ncbi:MAG: DNA replication and repair protein RecF [Chlorobium sp.]